MNFDVEERTVIDKDELFTKRLDIFEKECKRKSYITYMLIFLILFLIGTFFYAVSQFEFISFEQMVTADSADTQQINDGIHIDFGGEK